MGPTHTDKEKKKKASDCSTKVIGTFSGRLSTGICHISNNPLLKISPYVY
jgi:hypothetical protein